MYCFTGEKSLVRSDDDIIESQQPGQDIIGKHPVRHIFEKELAFLFIYIEAGRAYLPALQTLYRSAVLISFPLPVLISITPFFIKAMDDELIINSVSFVSGQLREIISEFLYTSSRET